MKKLVLTLGLGALAVLPIVAVASCSSTTKEIPTLTTEVAKYKNPFTVKEASKTMTPEAAVASINKGSNTEKINTLQNLVVLQLDNTNFTYTVGTATVGTNNVVDVSIKISEKADASKSETVKLVISGFAKPAESLLDKEVKRFTVSAEANEASKTQKSVAVVAKITEATGDAKLTELQKLTTVPEATSGFTIKVLTAKVGTPDTSVEVTIEVSETGTDNKANATFTVTGFATLSPQEILDEQVKLLVDQAVLDPKKGETPLQASTAIMSSLDEYYKKITLSPGITYSIKSATPNKTTLTTLDVVLTVSSSVEGVTAKDKNVEITAFTSPVTQLAQEAAKIEDKTVVASKAGETAAMAATAINNNTTLQDYYTEVTLSQGFSYTWKSNEVINNTVKVIVTVTGPDPLAQTMEHSFIISGFKTAADIEAAKFNITKPAKTVTGGEQSTTRQVVFGINKQTTQEKKLTVIEFIIDGFPKPASGFTLEIGSASSVGEDPDTSTSATVALTIKETATNNTAQATLTITGLTAETTQAEITRLLANNLVDKAVLEGKKGETAAIAGAAITSVKTLAPYYTLIPLPPTLKYNFVSKSVENDTVKVMISISLQNDTEAQQKEVVISGFKSAILAELEVEAAKLIDKESAKKDVTAAVAQPMAWNEEGLKQFYPEIQLSDGYAYGGVNKIEVDKAVTTTLNVTVAIYKRSNSEMRIFKVIKISGFQPLTAAEQEIQKFAISLSANDGTKTKTTDTVINEIRPMTTNTAKLARLKTYVTGFPDTTGFSFTDKGNNAAIRIRKNPETPTTSVILDLIVTKNPATGETATAPVEVQFIITGLGATAS